jgi:hypothetical protein
MIFSKQMESITSNINELKKNRSLLQRFRWNFHNCDSQNGREKMQEEWTRISKLLLLFTEDSRCSGERSSFQGAD